MTKPTLLVLAAGMGSRYGGLKQLDAVGPGGQTIIDYSVWDALRVGFGKVVFIIRRDFANVFREQIGSRYESQMEVAYAYQQLDALPSGFSVPEGRTKPWGTAHALLAARDAVHEPFAVINGDDFYGREALESAAEFLQDSSRHINDHCMVGYRLAGTLSKHGSVSRGICSQGRDGFLQHVVETHDIRREDGAVLAADPTSHGQTITLSGEETASMNLWGFQPSMFDHLAKGFETFLKESGTDLKAEIYIPTVVNELLETGEARVSVLSCDATWLGVTFREDNQHVQNEIANMTASGCYPQCFTDGRDESPQP